MPGHHVKGPGEDTTEHATACLVSLPQVAAARISPRDVLAWNDGCRDGRSGRRRVAVIRHISAPRSAARDARAGAGGGGEGRGTRRRSGDGDGRATAIPPENRESARRARHARAASANVARDDDGTVFPRYCCPARRCPAPVPRRGDTVSKYLRARYFCACRPGPTSDEARAEIIAKR